MTVSDEMEIKVQAILRFIDGAKQTADKRLIDKVLEACYLARRPAARLTLGERACAIRDKHQAGAPYRQLAAEYGVSEQLVKNICNGTIKYRDPHLYYRRRAAGSWHSI